MQIIARYWFDFDCEVAVGLVSDGLSCLVINGDGWPGLVVFRNCRNLIRTLPALCYCKRNPEDVDPDMEGHAVDALRYGLTRKTRGFRLVRVTGI